MLGKSVYSLDRSVVVIIQTISARGYNFEKRLHIKGRCPMSKLASRFN